jgi:hypothetical protein
MKPNELLSSALQHVIMGSVTKQSSNGRIVVQMRMPLNGDNMGTLPDWVARAYEDVSKKYSDVEPEVQEMSDLAIAFANDNQDGVMFAKRAVKVASASLRSFKVTRTGKPDSPEVELQFKLYLSFAREFWAWAGEMSGEDVYMTFPGPKPDQGPVAEAGDLPLEQAAPISMPESPSLEAATGEAEPAPDAGPATRSKATKKAEKNNLRQMGSAKPGGKSGPKDLAREHERQVEAGRAIN